MKSIFNTLILFVFLVFLSACSPSGNLSIQDSWARPGFRGDNSAVYLTIKNLTDQHDGLIGATCDVAGGAEIHLSKMDSSGTMTMERQDLVEVSASEVVQLAPGGLHIMLINLSKDLKIGDTFPITLEFQRAGDITVDVEVKQGN
ncbi:MAG: copper chaperone PCu(A)C [Chloroflexota bacterium]|nr:MAG: copper chaperone PCu(A)C [Chloroflexota bacterium]